MLATEQVTIVLHIAVLGQKLVRLTYLIVLKVQATVFLVTRELKQTDAAAERRRRSTSKFLSRRTQGQVNSVGP